jgi:transcriptional regulator with XRE-family HTH domain
MPRNKMNVDKLSKAAAAVFKDRREALGLSQQAVADKTGFHRSYIGDFEMGRRAISVKTLSRLAEGLDMSAFTLLARAERELRR